MCVNSVTTFEIYNIYIIYISNKKNTESHKNSRQVLNMVQILAIF